MARERIGEGFVEARLDTSRLDRDAEQVERRVGRSFEKAGKQMQETGRRLTRRVTAPIVGLGIAVARTAATYESSMNRVAALTGATGDELDRLGQRAQELGRTTQFSAAQAADAMAFLAMAGFDVNQIYDAMPGVLNLAAAGQLDLASAADIASNVLQGLNLDVSQLDHLIDVMAKTTTSANTDMRQLGDAMVFVAPVAAAAGVQVEELTAAVGLLGDAGIQAGMAGTSLRGAITRLLSPSNEAASVMSRLGLEAANADGTLRPLNQIIEQLADSGATTADMMVLFGQRAGPAMSALVARGADALRDLTGELEDAGGTAEAIAERQMEGLNGSLARMRSAFEGVAIAVGESGLLNMLAAFAEALAAAAQWLAETNPAVLRYTTLALGLYAALGPVMWISGGLLATYTRMLPALRAVATATSSVAAAKSAMGTAAVGAQLGMMSLAKFAFHPLTLAIGAATVGLTVWSRRKQEAKQRVEELTAAIQADSGALGENTRARAANMLETRGALEAAELLGIELDTLTSAALGEADALREVNRAVDGVMEAWGQREIGNFSQELAFQHEAAHRVRNALGELHPALEEAQATAGRVAEATGDTSEEMDEAAQAALDLIDPLALLGDEYSDTGSAADKLAEATRRYIDQARAQVDPIFNVFNALDKLEDAQAEVNRLAGEGRQQSEEYRQALWDETRATQDADFALREFAQALADGSLSSESLEERMEFLQNEFGLSEDAAELLIGKLGEYEERVETLPDEHSTELEVDDAAAIASIDAYIRRLDRIPSTVTTRLRTTGEVPTPRASGGRLGPGELGIVGERGPELVRFDRQAFVTPADLTSALMDNTRMAASMDRPAAVHPTGPTGGGGGTGTPWNGASIVVNAPSTDARDIVEQTERATRRAQVLAGL